MMLGSSFSDWREPTSSSRTRATSFGSNLGCMRISANRVKPMSASLRKTRSLAVAESSPPSAASSPPRNSICSAIWVALLVLVPSSGTSHRLGPVRPRRQGNEDADCAGVLVQVFLGDTMDVLFGDASELVHIVGDVLPACPDGLSRAEQHGLSEDGVLLEEVAGLHLVLGLLEFVVRRL